MGLDVTWDPELARTPEGYYQVQGGIPYAIAKSLAVAPYADLLWMETKTADLADAKQFADAIHAVYPDQMLAYNLSPSFNWDTTGMNDDEMRDFPEELGRMGFVFNFITYGGHQIDGLAAEEFSAALREDGMLALARLQRKFRLLESPYRTPQTLVGGPRADAALASLSGQTATTKAMGEGSTQTPAPRADRGAAEGARRAGSPTGPSTTASPAPCGSRCARTRPARTCWSSASSARPATSWPTSCSAPCRTGVAGSILSVRDQNTFDAALRRKRLMTLLHVFLIHRYKASSIHYLTPTEDNHRQTDSMKARGIFSANARGDRGDHRRRRQRRRGPLAHRPVGRRARGTHPPGLVHTAVPWCVLNGAPGRRLISSGSIPSPGAPGSTDARWARAAPAHPRTGSSRRASP